MNVNDQVISLKLAKKLKKLGVKQESLFYWCIIDNGVDGEQDIIPLTEKEMDYYDDVLGSVEYTVIASAFTCAELGEMLPGEIEYKVAVSSDNLAGIRTFYLEVDKSLNEPGEWCVYYYDDPKDLFLGKRYFTDKVEANARAKTLVWLVENGYLKLKEEK